MPISDQFTLGSAPVATAVALPVVSFLLVWALFGLLERSYPGRYRVAFLKATLLQGAAIVLLTEGLSLFQQLTRSACISFWALVLPMTAIGLGMAWKHQNRQNTSLSPFALRLGLVSKVTVIATFLILILTLMTALVSAPNNWDAMVYHLPRVMHWIQQQSVAHYPTHETRQLTLVGGAGYWVTHMYLLSGSDRFSNLVQWLAFVGCIVNVSLLAQNLADRSAAWLAALVCSTIPMAIMQAATPQTDLIAGCWLLAVAYFVLVVERPTDSSSQLTPSYSQPWHQFFSHRAGLSRPQWLWITVALALAIVTKPTNWVFALPLLGILWLRGWEYTQNQELKGFNGFLQSLGQSIAVGIASLSLTIPSLWRNYQTFGSVFGDLGKQTGNAVIGLRPLLSHALKTLAINLPIPGLWRAVDWLHTHILRLSVADSRFNLGLTPLADPNSGTGEALVKVVAPHEDFVGYPLHLLLLGIAIIAIAFWQARRSVPVDRRVYLLIFAVGFNLLSFWFLFKWQPWENRLLLPIALLGVPIIAVYLRQFVRPRWQLLIASGLGLLAIAYALTPIRHPLVALPSGAQEQSPSILTLPREAMYFSGARKELQAPYTVIAQRIQARNCQRVGLVLAGEGWEYPLWVLLQQQAPVKIRHVAVENPSAQRSPFFPDQDLCAIVSFRPDYQPTDLDNSGEHFVAFPVSDDPPISLFERAPNL